MTTKPNAPTFTELFQTILDQPGLIHEAFTRLALLVIGSLGLDGLEYCARGSRPHHRRRLHRHGPIARRATCVKSRRSRCRGYVQHWLRGGEISEKSIQKIFKAADTILRAGRVDQVEQLEEAA
jgi:hypothetical protein